MFVLIHTCCMIPRSRFVNTLHLTHTLSMHIRTCDKRNTSQKNDIAHLIFPGSLKN